MKNTDDSDDPLNYENRYSYVKRYVWHRFTHSWYNILIAVFLPILIFGIEIPELPAWLHLIDLIPIGLLYTSFYLNKNNYAAQGARKFLQEYEEAKRQKVLNEFHEIEDFGLTWFQNLKQQLMEGYFEFTQAVESQTIITEHALFRFMEGANDAFDQGTTLLKEMRDILDVMKGFQREELVREAENSSVAQEKLKIYDQNAQKLDEFKQVLEKKIDVFELNRLKLVSATSDFSEMEEAEKTIESFHTEMEAAVAVQKSMADLKKTSTYN